jgi:hypothetical protein
MATIYSDIGLLLLEKGDYDGALEWPRKAQAIEESIVGMDHPDTATYLQQYWRVRPDSLATRDSLLLAFLNYNFLAFLHLNSFFNTRTRLPTPFYSSSHF